MRRKIEITITALLSIIIMVEIGVIIGRVGKSGISGTADKSNANPAVAQVLVASKVIKINNEQIPVYSIEGKDTLYLLNTDLELFGFECKLGDEGYTVANISGDYGLSSDSFTDGVAGQNATLSSKKLIESGRKYDCYQGSGVVLFPSEAVAMQGRVIETDTVDYYEFGTDAQIEEMIKISRQEIAAASGADTETAAEPVETSAPTSNSQTVSVAGNTSSSQTAQSGTTSSSSTGASVSVASSGKKIIVLDPGHGKSSGLMSESEKTSSGWVKNSSGSWGEWRHYKTGTHTDCEGEGCNHRVTPNGACWYPIGNGDRSTEPEINLNNALAAEKYLTQMGYEVRMTRRTNDENPSITKRLTYCYPNNDISQPADATLFICIHSNAGGGSGSAYITLSGSYDQPGIKSTYVEDGNRLGKLCNDRIVSETSMSMSGGGTIGGEPELIAFCKAPVTCGYLEIGFFDNSSDLSILNSESDKIGKAIAEGIDDFCKGN